MLSSDDMLRKSATALDTFSSCPRKWAWKAIAGIPSPPTPSTALGELVHSELERYLKEGTLPDQSSDAGRIATDGLKLLPAPKTPGMIVEKKFDFSMLGHTYTGRLDFEIGPYPIDARGNPLTVVDGAVGVGMSLPTVGDHKTTGDMAYAKTPDVLKTDVQAILYAVYAIAQYKSEGANLVWTYFRTKGTPKSKRTHLPILKKEVESFFLDGGVEVPWKGNPAGGSKKGILQLSEEMEEAYHKVGGKGGDVLSLPFNPDACGKFGGCPYVGMCNLTAEERMQGIMAQNFGGNGVNLWGVLGEPAVGAPAAMAAGTPPSTPTVTMPALVPPPAQVAAPSAPVPAQGQVATDTRGSYVMDPTVGQYWHCHCGLKSSLETLGKSLGACSACGRMAENFPVGLYAPQSPPVAAPVQPAPTAQVAAPVAAPVQPPPAGLYAPRYAVNPPESQLAPPAVPAPAAAPFNPPAQSGQTLPPAAPPETYTSTAPTIAPTAPSTAPPGPNGEVRGRGRPKGSKNKPKDPFAAGTEATSFPPPRLTPGEMPAVVIPAMAAVPSPAIVEAPAVSNEDVLLVTSPPVTQDPSFPTTPTVSKVVLPTQMTKRIGTLYVNCLPLNEQVTDASELLESCRDQANRLSEQPDYRMIEFGKAPGIFTFCVSEALKTFRAEAVYVNTDSPEAKTVLTLLTRASSRVVKGV